MRLLVQRVKHAKVTVANQVIGEVAQGLLVFIGVTHLDTEKEADYLASRLLKLRIFSDENDKMNLSVSDIAGEILVVSQFTLYADTKKGNRPGYSEAALPEVAEKLYEYFIKKLKESELKIGTGKFGADMQIDLCNDGPVTISLEN